MAFSSTLSPFMSRLLRPFTTSASLSLQPADALAGGTFPPNAQRATIAAGCFWGVEHLYRKHFGNGKGLLDARVGYTGGATSGVPSYRQVCSGSTGHAESLLVIFDPEKVTYRQLLEFFFKMHDPTTLNRQGNDVGTQYRSAIFANDDAQLQIAQEVKDQVAKQWFPGKSVSTEIARAGQWFDAEDYHQLYLDNNPGGYECPLHYVRDFKPLSQ